MIKKFTEQKNITEKIIDIPPSMKDIEKQKKATLEFLKENKFLYFLLKIKILETKYDKNGNINLMRCSPLNPLSYIILIYDFLVSLVYQLKNYFKYEHVFKYQ
jgi:hypothetical protein